MTFAKHEFELNRVVGGQTIRAQLEEVQRVHPTAHFADRLQNPEELPDGMSHIWAWFLELSNTGRIYGGPGIPMPLTSLEIWAWTQLRQVQLAPWELSLIRQLDIAWLTAQRSKD